MCTLSVRHFIEDFSPKNNIPGFLYCYLFVILQNGIELSRNFFSFFDFQDCIFSIFYTFSLSP